MKSVAFITLGCPKNSVNSEKMAYDVKKAGFKLARDPAHADMLVINTCCFINDAKEESVAAVFDAIVLKRQNPGLKIIVCGCLAQRYADELLKEIPEIDVLAGVGAESEIGGILKSLRRRSMPDINLSIPETGRIRADHSATAYLKISEGCDKHCTYCIIPQIRGMQRSRRMEDIVSEAQMLAEEGVKEIIVVAQDTGEYGTDIYGGRMLAELLKKLEKIEGIAWIRLLYVYPETINEELIETIAGSAKILRYLDIPFQHASDRILRLMGRRTSLLQIRNLICRLREKMPDIVIRSGFITGFPGETTVEVLELEKFLKEEELLRVGIFAYSQEEGTPAAAMDGQIEDSEKLARREKIMQAQQDISKSLLRRMIGKKLDVLLEEQCDEYEYAGRSYMDAPEIDGQVYVCSQTPLKIGSIVGVMVEDSLEYDLCGRYADE